jgi:hypothetical protein
MIKIPSLQRPIFLPDSHILKRSKAWVSFWLAAETKAQGQYVVRSYPMCHLASLVSPEVGVYMEGTNIASDESISAVQSAALSVTVAVVAIIISRSAPTWRAPPNSEIIELAS